MWASPTIGGNYGVTISSIHGKLRVFRNSADKFGVLRVVLICVLGGGAKRCYIDGRCGIAAAGVAAIAGTVSYTHLTLPTICSV